jgi:tRNA(fMet)-specific endonuclease VapC
VRYLLDTNILSDLVRNPQGTCARRLLDVDESAVCTSVIVAAELWYGATKRNSSRLTSQLELVLSTIEIMPLEPPVERVYGSLRARLERLGKTIGANDLLIAAQTLALEYTLVTDNEREFARLPELRQVNWIR